MRSSTKYGLLEIAAQAIDTKCRGDDHFPVLKLVKMIEEHPHEGETKEDLITMLMLDESQEPYMYVKALRQLEDEINA